MKVIPLKIVEKEFEKWKKRTDNPKIQKEHTVGTCSLCDTLRLFDKLLKSTLLTGSEGVKE